MDPLAGSSWSTPETVAGFVRSPANQVLLARAARELTHAADARACDIGCGAGRNAVPHALQATAASRMLLVMLRDITAQDGGIISAIP